MSPEKPVEGKTTTTAQRNCEQIITRLTDYLSIRFDHAGRINPHLKVIKQDLIYHELANIRRTLLGEKIYGQLRLVVADVLLGDDDKRRRALLSPNDQTSIQVEIVSHCQEEVAGQGTRGNVKIHDLKTFYAAINPALSGLMDLIETWVWWDILDAAELVRFEQKLGLTSLIRQGRVSDELRKRYLLLIHPAVANEEEAVPLSISNEEILHYEIRQLLSIRDQWANRHHGERGYLSVLKRDAIAVGDKQVLVQQIVLKAREYDAIKQMEELSDEVRSRYSAELRMVPEKVTQRAVIDQIQGQMLDLERTMQRQADHEVDLGAPYNYKERQMEQMDRWLFDLNQQMRALAKPTAPTGGAADAASAVLAKPTPSETPDLASEK